MGTLTRHLRWNNERVDFVLRGEPTGDGRVLDLSDRDRARRWLHALAREPGGVGVLRVLARTHTAQTTAVSDRDTVEAVAVLLARHTVRVVLRKDPGETWLLAEEKPEPDKLVREMTWNRLPPVNAAATTVTHEPPPRWATSCTVVDPYAAEG